ncbi:MAG: hypothetical protein ABIK67_00480 [candidate division WOR-3 bacterium]
MNFEPSFCKSFRSNFVEYSLLVRKMHENNEKQLTYGDFSNITDSLYKRAVVLQDNNLRLDPKSVRHKKHWKILSAAVDNFVRVLSLRKEFIEKLNIYYKKELSKDKQADLILNRLRDLEKKSLKIDSSFLASHLELSKISEGYNVSLIPPQSFTRISALEGWTNIVLDLIKEFKIQEPKVTKEKHRTTKRDIVHIGDAKDRVKKYWVTQNLLSNGHGEKSGVMTISG